MTETNVIKLSQPGTFCDPLTEVLRSGARSMLAHAIEAEVAAFVGNYADLLTADGRRRLVRHGHLPEREIATGIGPVGVRPVCATAAARTGSASASVPRSCRLTRGARRASKS